jgi:hypothetical protein
MHQAERKLSRLQKDILRVLLAHLEAERQKSDRQRREAEAHGIQVRAIRQGRQTGADCSALSPGRSANQPVQADPGWRGWQCRSLVHAAKVLYDQ